MKIGSMLGEILRSVFRKTATVKYPFGVRQAVPDRLRGVLTMIRRSASAACCA